MGTANKISKKSLFLIHDPISVIEPEDFLVFFCVWTVFRDVRVISEQLLLKEEHLTKMKNLLEIVKERGEDFFTVDVTKCKSWTPHQVCTYVSLSPNK